MAGKNQGHQSQNRVTETTNAKAATLAGLTFFLLSACGQLGAANRKALESPMDSLVDSDWSVDRLASDSGADVKTLTLSFVGRDRVAGYDGCNSFSGAVTIRDSALKVSDKLAATTMACPDVVASRARAYRADLLRVTQYTIKNAKLELTDADGKPLITLAASAITLAGSSWETISYNNGKQAMVSLIIGTKIGANFGADGRLSGNAGCNSYFAGYKTSGQTIVIDAPGATKRACINPEGVMTQEAQFLQAINSATQFRISGGRLDLRNAQGSMVATFMRSSGP
jgi:heat shock protein HslJ